MTPAHSENAPEFEIVTLKSGERSIRSLRHGETMHVGTGPRSEALALHIEQQHLVRRAQEKASGSQPFAIWDVGLGPAGNALTALESLRGVKVPVEIHSFEISTAILSFALLHAPELGYLAGWEEAVGELLKKNTATPLPHVRWHLHLGDFLESVRSAFIPPPASVFHDPYSPAKNPEMWSLETFRLMRERTAEAGAPPCLLTNYTRSTAIRVTLALAGWFVGTGVPTGDKTETTIAASRLDLLDRPLDRDWLRRVRGSTNAAPFRDGVYAPGPISTADLETLESLPQFKQD